jgi:anthranilate phosphoribosyltransferase
MSTNLAPLIKELSCGTRCTRHLDEETACALFAAILSGEVHAPERDAVLDSLQSKGGSLVEMRGFMRALDAHVGRLEAPADRPRPVILPTFAGTRRNPNLTALLALLLKRYGVPVLAHGNDAARVPTASAARFGRVTTLEILLELGIEPAARLRDAQARLVQNQLVYVPLLVLAPGLVPLLDYRSPPRVRSFARSLANLIDPFGGDSYRVVSVTRQEDFGPMREFLATTRADAMLLRGAEGEACTNPRRQSQLDAFTGGSHSICAESESGDAEAMAAMPVTIDAPTTAAWISRMLAGESPVPSPIIVQLACCLQGARRPANAD